MELLKSMMSVRSISSLDFGLSCYFITGFLWLHPSHHIPSKVRERFCSFFDYALHQDAGFTIRFPSFKGSTSRAPITTTQKGLDCHQAATIPGPSLTMIDRHWPCVTTKCTPMMDSPSFLKHQANHASPVNNQ